MTTLNPNNSIQVNNRDERTAGGLAVIQAYGVGTGADAARHFSPVLAKTNARPSSPSLPSLPSPTDKPRSTKTRRMARRWSWMKEAGGYLDLSTYYKGELATQKLKACHEWWHREQHKKTKDIRVRAQGCGDIHVCPLCSSYKQLRLAGEAFDEMLLAQEALEVDQVQLETYGLKLVFTLHKDMSRELDRDLFEGCDRWQRNLSDLFKLVSKLIRKWFGPGCGFVLGLDLTGESAPTEPHYHFNVYLFPARKAEGEWVPLPKWVAKEGKGLSFQTMRQDWANAVRRIFPHEMAEMDVNFGFLSGPGAVRNWLEYQYRPILSDLWRGWRGFDGHSVAYEYRKPKSAPVGLLLPLDDVLGAFDRVNRIPAHFKRLRWCGVFSDGQRALTMQALGLSKEELPEGDDSQDGWESIGEAMSFVRYTRVGVVLRELNGIELEFPDGVVHYGPSGVVLGKRTRWRAPGD